MRGLWRSLVLACACCALGAAYLPAAAPASTPAATAEISFSLSLLRAIGGSGNLVYSPYSIDLALTMSDAGAAGQTAGQIEAVLHAGSGSEALRNAASLRQALDEAVRPGASAPTLDVANGLWAQSGLALQPPFVEALTSGFGAPPQSTNFAGAPDAALAAINAWIAEHTGQLIQNMLSQGSITPQTALVLANAIYLKALWQNPFAPSSTAPAPFTTADGQIVRVPFMNQSEAHYAYASGPSYQAVDLPYTSSSLSLLAILPHGETLSSFEKSLSASSLRRIVGSLSERSVDLSMPKLDLSTQTSLNEPLQALGMSDAFKTTADFSGITTQRSLYISLVEHAAKLKIDEQGTVATGATVIVMPTAAVPAPTRTVDVTLNHPYLLLLRDDASGTILFVGRVANPSTS